MKINIITIDGPAGSGKGKIAKYVAKKWKLKHLDSGIFYRRIAYIISKKKINPIDKTTIKILINGIDQISSQKNKILRSEKISNIASIIAEYKFVRDFVNTQQKLTVKKSKNKNGFVIDGRDIGSVVFPNADLKLFLKASEQVRAKRRYDELIDEGYKVDYKDILENIISRDSKDTKRKDSPLIIAKDAVVIDNSELSINDQLDIIIKLIDSKF